MSLKKALSDDFSITLYTKKILKSANLLICYSVFTLCNAHTKVRKWFKRMDIFWNICPLWNVLRCAAKSSFFREWILIRPCSFKGQCDEKVLRDVILVLLKQLDISWMDTDETFTQEILNVISIFVKNLKKSIDHDRKTPEPKRGKLTRFIKGMKLV